MARLGDLVQIEGHELLTGGNAVTLGDMGREAVALHVDGIDTDMQQNGDAVIALHGNRMARGEQSLDGSGDRRDEHALARFDGDAVPHGLAREHRVAHRLELDDRSRNGAGDLGAGSRSVLLLL